MLSKIDSRQLDVRNDLYLVRTPFINPMMFIPGLLDTARWRLVGAEPINKLARRMIQREVSSLNWTLRIAPKGYEDRGINFEGAKAYYQDCIKDFRGLSAKALKSICELPQGGAWEVGWIQPAIFGEGARGTLSFVEFIDAGTLHPTTSPDFPIVQIDPIATLRRVLFSDEEIVRILAFPYDEFDKEWWQESPTMASYMAIEALSRIYIYYLKQLHDTPVAGILDLLDFSEDDARQWATSFREMLEGIDPVKIPILYEHKEPAKWIPMGRNPSELSISEQFRQYAEIVLSNYGLSTGDLRILEGQNQSKASAAMNRKITMQSGISFFAELIKDGVQFMLPPYLKFEYDEPDLEEERTKAMIRASDARTIQTLPWLPTDYKAVLAKRFGIFSDLDFDLEKLVDESERTLGVNPGVQGIPSPAPGQLFQGEGAVPNQLETNARENASTGTKVFAKSETANDTTDYTEHSVKDLIQQAVDEYKDKLGTPSKYGNKTQKAAAKFEKILKDKFKKAAKGINPEYIGKIINEVHAKVPALKTQSELNKAEYLDDNIPTTFINKADGDPTVPPNDYQEPIELLREKVDSIVENILSNLSINPSSISSGDILELLVAIYKLSYEDGMLATSEVIQNNLYGRGIAAAPGLILSFDVTDSGVMSILESMAADMVRNVDEGTKYYLRRIIVEGAMQGWSVDQISEAIQKDVFGLPATEAAKLPDARIRSIVTTELNRADSAGRLEEMSRMGLKSKRWITRGVGVCDLCLTNESYGSVPLDYEYEDVFGPTLHPPGHPGTCHCALGADENELNAISTMPDYWTGD